MPGRAWVSWTSALTTGGPRRYDPDGDTAVMRIVHDPRCNGCMSSPFLVAPTSCRLRTVDRAWLARVFGRELRWGQWLFSRTLRSLRAKALGWPAYPDSLPRKPPWWLGNT